MSEVTVESIRERLVKRQGSYPSIAARAEVSYSWLQKFANGERGKRPEYESVAKLVKELDRLDAEEAETSEGSTNVQEKPAARQAAPDC